MNKTFIKTIISFVFLAIFNIIFFFEGVEHTNTAWCSYGFATFAYICLCATPLFAKESYSAVLIGSLWIQSTIFFFVELVTAIICIFINPESLKWPLIIQSILLALFIIMQLMTVLANNSTTTSLKNQQKSSRFKQTLINQLQQKTLEIKDPDIKKLLSRCLDSLSNSPLHEYSETQDIDINLQNTIDTLCEKINEENMEQIKSLSNQIIHIIQERNLIIKKCRIK